MVQEVVLQTLLRYRKARPIAGFLLLGALLNGCALILPQYTKLTEERPPDLPVQAELKEVPFFAQEEYQCGPAAVAMVMNAAGVQVTPEQMVEQVYLPARKGSLQIEMLVAPRRHGLIAYELAPQLTDLLRDPWDARNFYIDLILGGSRNEFFSRHARRLLSASEQTRALTLLEMQCHALLMFTSCGWFFSEISGIETVQILRYAARALELSEELGISSPRARFLEMLAAAPSNVPKFGNAAAIFRELVDTRAGSVLV